MENKVDLDWFYSNFLDVGFIKISLLHSKSKWFFERQNEKILKTLFCPFIKSVSNSKFGCPTSLVFATSLWFRDFARITNIHSVRINRTRTDCVSLSSSFSRGGRRTGVVFSTIITTANRELKINHSIRCDNLPCNILKYTYVAMNMDFVANVVWENEGLDRNTNSMLSLDNWQSFVFKFELVRTVIVYKNVVDCIRRIRTKIYKWSLFFWGTISYDSYDMINIVDIIFTLELPNTFPVEYGHLLVSKFQYGSNLEHCNE